VRSVPCGALDSDASTADLADNVVMGNGLPHGLGGVDTGGNVTGKLGGGQSSAKKSGTSVMAGLLQFDFDDLPFNRALIG
jgi:hypothetical protein